MTLGKQTTKTFGQWISTVAVLILTLGLCLTPWASFADGYTIDDVKAMIADLPADPLAYMQGDADLEAAVNAAAAAYDSLSAEDQAKLDTEVKGDQPYGRILESALWALWSTEAPDNSTTLPDGVYDATTVPTLGSEYSKGKSTSSRQRPWSVQIVEVRDGLAYATVTVDSTSYPSMVTGGVEYPNVAEKGNCVFEGIPVDLNSTFYFAGVSSSMPRPIMFSLTTEIDEPPAQVTVTFTDGQGNVIDQQVVDRGGSATAPVDPEREGYVFAGWDAPFDNVTADLTVNATWAEPEATLYDVRFTDGLGTELKTQRVKEGEAATAPDDPTREGYVFAGWDVPFDDVTADLTVNATWVSIEQAQVDAVRTMSAALPDDPKTLLGDTDNAAVAEAGAAYNALTFEQRTQLSDDERLKMAKVLIAVLPSDPYAVTEDTSAAIGEADTAYDNLPSELKNRLDKDTVSSGRSYGYHLQVAVWALDSLRTTQGATYLQNGVYRKSVIGTSNMGKSSRPVTSQQKFTVKYVKVKDGAATALIEHSSNSTQTLRLGGKDYENLQTDPAGNSYYEIPVNLNSTFHFMTKGKNATAQTAGIAYEMTIRADIDTMQPDSPLPAEGETIPLDDDSGQGSENQGGSDLHDATIDDVKAMIAELPTDPLAYMQGDADLEAAVNAAAAAYDSLSEEDRAALDTEVKGDQPYGRILESAQWTLWSLKAPDNSTSLPDGTYDANTVPALGSEYSKGKSTSARQRPWSVQSIEVRDGGAYATITVESNTYSSMMTGGVEYQSTVSDGNCVFEDVPIGLNSTFYFAGASTVMPRPIMFSLTTSIDESAAWVTVTFIDGQGNVLDQQVVERGGSATAPADPVREGYVFDGWDAPFDDVTSDLTVNAKWVILYDVEFTDGFGSVLETQRVKEGEAATAPDDPARKGYVFDGWDAPFDNVTANLTVNAKWVSVEQVQLEAARAMIAALPDDPKTLLGDTGNAAVAEASAAYLALSPEQHALIPDDERLKLAESVIAVLPSDPLVVTEGESAAITAADSIYDSLPSKLTTQLDKDKVSDRRTYAYHLQVAVWAFDSLRTKQKTTFLKDGVYRKSVSGTSNMGKSSRPASSQQKFTVKYVKVKGGSATALIEHSSDSTQTLRLGGKDYENLNPTGKSRYEIPVNLNTTFHFVTKGKDYKQGETEGIAYEMVISADVDTMQPDSPLPAEGEAIPVDDDSEQGSENQGGSGSGNQGGSGSDDNSGSGSGSNDNSGSGSSSDDDSGSNSNSNSESELGGGSGSTSGGSGGTAGNLNSLVSNNSNSNSNSNSTTTNSTSKNSTSSVSAASSADTKTKDNATTGSKNAGAQTLADANGAGTDGLASITAGIFNANDDMSPAVVGVLALAAALGFLGFVTRFVRREGI